MAHAPRRPAATTAAAAAGGAAARGPAGAAPRCTARAAARPRPPSNASERTAAADARGSGPAAVTLRLQRAFEQADAAAAQRAGDEEGWEGEEAGEAGGTETETGSETESGSVSGSGSGSEEGEEGEQQPLVRCPAAPATTRARKQLAPGAAAAPARGGARAGRKRRRETPAAPAAGSDGDTDAPAAPYTAAGGRPRRVPPASASGAGALGPQARARVHGATLPGAGSAGACAHASQEDALDRAVFVPGGCPSDGVAGGSGGAHGLGPDSRESAGQVATRIVATFAEELRGHIAGRDVDAEAALLALVQTEMGELFSMLARPRPPPPLPTIGVHQAATRGSAPPPHPPASHGPATARARRFADLSIWRSGRRRVIPDAPALAPPARRGASGVAPRAPARREPRS